MNGENGASRRWKVGDNVSFHLNAGGGKQFNDEANKIDNEMTFKLEMFCSSVQGDRIRDGVV